MRPTRYRFNDNCHYLEYSNDPILQRAELSARAVDAVESNATVGLSQWARNADATSNAPAGSPMPAPPCCYYLRRDLNRLY